MAPLHVSDGSNSMWDSCWLNLLERNDSAMRAEGMPEHAGDAVHPPDRSSYGSSTHRATVLFCRLFVQLLFHRSCWVCSVVRVRFAPCHHCYIVMH